ncbi:hypothetical protein [Streptomyces yerevanensis]|uniref:hypothetical protein n=1 Tax=Streptomyces yerevanensis TaxID=66378 RepID=UPI0012FE829B|nr:hypothetical protein [Streptomyces yerevanensis]
MSHLQSVIGDGEYVRHQTAYRAYIEHASTCPDCVEGICPTARKLWRVVKGRAEPDA